MFKKRGKHQNENKQAEIVMLDRLLTQHQLHNGRFCWVVACAHISSFCILPGFVQERPRNIAKKNI